MKKTLLYSLLLVLVVDVIQFWPRPTASDRVAALAPRGNQVAIQAVAASPIPQPTSAAEPTPDNVMGQVATTLLRHGLKADYANLYLSVQARTGTPWQIIAAVHHYETNQSATTTRTSSAGAVGPFQFLPATWHHYALDGNADGQTSVADVSDAAMTAGHYLAVSGAASHHYSQALYTYNHSQSYVNHTLGLASELGL